MGFQTLHDVIEQSQSIHSALSQKYKELEYLASSDEALWLLEYLNRHESRLADALKIYDEDLSSHIKGTCLQQDPHWVEDEIFTSLDAIDINDPRALMAAALSMDTAIVDGYRALARTTDNEEIRSALSSILKMEDQEQHQIAKGLISELSF